MTMLFLLAGPVIAIIIVLTIIQRRKAQNKAVFAAKLKALTSSHGLELDLFEQFNNRLIGLDHQQGKLLFIEFHGSNWNFNMFHVDQIKACAVLRSPASISSVGTANTNNYSIPPIGLQCHMEDGSIVTLPFYSAHTDKFHDATALTRKAAYWRRKINGMLTKHEEPEFF
ncbi:hypothetical protein [Flavihumibacter sp.]|uniref:hypothetical protein n=1 Tax=Flavihumibacter sp. TaxID=1913981 RepID=UPI002FC697EB|nr:hypothetical protein [Flavihumibacter sediminis]